MNDWTPSIVDPPPSEVGAAAGDELRSVGVIGAGWMGRQVALVNLERGFPVTLVDVSAAALEAAAQWIESERSHQQAGSAGPALCTTIRPDALRACDVIVESVVEDLAVKQPLLAEVEAQVPATALVASNTSSLPISQLASVLTRPERFLGLHFCHPVRQRPLVEVVPGALTTSETTARGVAYARALGKQPLVVGDRPGFLLNRLLTPYLNTAVELLSDGVDAYAIEAAARTFGFPMGPFTFLDEIGLDTALRVGMVM
ncbi:MAG: 3-hydroxyacyl-CoA dehydrogenase family protein, partial [Planctomycetes bacterium]|nr:3-hydroxyacyl-CoA dehydrogenase family protein [Planctomycetota bacterium]